jgi:hypothetical protein
MVFDMELCAITPSISSDQGGRLEARVRQREHYKKMTFEDEFLALLEKAGVPHDQNMCWDELSAAPPALDHLHNRFPAMPGWLMFGGRPSGPLGSANLFHNRFAAARLSASKDLDSRESRATDPSPRSQVVRET